MMRNKYDTYSVQDKDIDRKWLQIDATGLTLGRLATKVAYLLRGKHKTMYQPNMDTGDFVIITNIEKIKVTGNKEIGKEYHFHTGFPGGLKTFTYKMLMARSPQRVIEHAVKGMLPKGRMGRAMIKKLKVYTGESHPHQAQNPDLVKV
jgi:large subunit ribosomal protein L13